MIMGFIWGAVIMYLLGVVILLEIMAFEDGAYPDDEEELTLIALEWPYLAIKVIINHLLGADKDE